MNVIQSKLAKIKELGLHINDDNLGYKATTDKAKKYVKEYMTNRPYKWVIGSVLASNESLDKVEYDICFYVCEEAYSKLSSLEEYKELHELAKNNDAVAFTDHLDSKLSGDDSEVYTNEDRVYLDMIEDVQDFMTDVENELDSIIWYLGGKIDE